MRYARSFQQVLLGQGSRGPGGTSSSLGGLSCPSVSGGAEGAGLGCSSFRFESPSLRSEPDMTITAFSMGM